MHWMALTQHGRNALRQITKESSDRVLHHPLLFSCQGVRYRRLEKVDKLGKAGETVKICQPEEEEEEEEEEEVRVIRKSEDNMSREFEKAARRLENARLVLRRFPNIEKLRSRASKDDPVELRSRVTKEELVVEVARQLSFSIEPENLHLPSPLSAFREYEVPMRLPKAIPLPEGKVQWILNVKVRGK
ncbi:hypothetical protein WN944_014234 [Citrus x changshan-huyou]|uniref:CL9 n=1 Tax=Citrus x changshan-huyou TaxID=2935761 RepID=A0AAP0M7I0_9ROSI